MKSAVRHIFLYFLFLGMTVFTSAEVQADLSLKKKIIENCKEAVSEIKILSEKDREELVPYLALVLSLQAHQLQESPIESPKRPGPFNSPFDDPLGAEVWRSFDPGREIEAKRCAVEVLKLLTPLSFQAVPEIVLLAEDKVTPSSLRDLLGEGMIAITTGALHDPQYKIPPETVAKISGLPGTKSEFYAERVLIELGDVAIPFLLEEMRLPDAKHRDGVTRVLKKIDRTGVRIGPGLLSLLGSGDDGLRKRVVQLLGELEGYYPESVIALIDRLADLSEDVSRESAKALEEVFRHNVELALSPEAMGRLIDAYTRVKPPTRDLLEVGVSRVGPKYDRFEADLLGKDTSSDLDLRLRIIRQLGSLPKLKGEGFAHLKNALTDSESTVQTTAIESLGSQKARVSEVISSFIGLLKEADAGKDEPRKRGILTAVAKSLVKIGSVQEGNRLSQYLVDGLSMEEPRSPILVGLRTAPGELPIVQALILIGRDAVGHVVSSLASKALSVRINGAYVLGKIRPTESRSIKSLIDLFPDERREVRDQAEQSLISMGAEVVPLVQRALKSTNAHSKLSAAKVLYQFTPTDKALIPILIDGVKRAGCGEKADLIHIVSKLQSGTSSQLADMILDCISAQSVTTDSMLPSLLALSPLPSTSLEKLVQMMKEGKLGTGPVIKLIQRWKEFGVPVDQAVAVLLELLKNGDNSVKYVAINTFGEMGPDGKGGIEALRNIQQSGDYETLLRQEAVVALARIDRSSFDFEGFFAKELTSDRVEWAERSLRKLGPSLAAPILEKSLGELPEDKRAPIIAAIGDLREDGSRFVPMLTTLLESKTQPLRYSALVSLLKLQPQNTDALGALRREIFDDSSTELLSEDLPQELIPVLESIVATAPTQVERSFATDLIEAIRAHGTKD